MGSIFSYSFMQRAMLAGVFISSTCALLGVFLVLRKDSMLGHGLAHSTFAGVALGLFLNVMPMVTALIVAVICAFFIIKLREKAGIYEDTAIGILSSVGLALGIILTSLKGSFNVGLMSYLFGNILAISRLEVIFSVVLAVITFCTIIIFYHELLFITFDPESAKTCGIRVNLFEGILILLTSVVVVMGMKIVGLLLITALIVIPAASGLQIANSFFKTALISIIIACSSIIAGLLSAFYLNLPASGAVILVSAVLFLLLLSLRLFRSRSGRI